MFCLRRQRLFRFLRPRREEQGRGREKQMWMVLLVLSLCVNAFFLLFVHSSWLVPGRPLSRPAWASQGDSGALTSHPAARSQNKSNETLAGSENLAKRTKNGAEDVSRTRRRPSRSGEVSGRVERSAVRRRTPDEKPVAAGGDLEPLRLLTNRSSSYITDAELGLPRSWRQNPNNTARVRYVLGTIQDFPPEDFRFANVSFFTPRKHLVNTYRPKILVHASKCPEAGPFLLLVIPSVDFHVKDRLAVRRTWASVLYGGAWPGDSRNFSSVVKLVFFFGKSWNFASIRDESRRYNDVVQADFVDSYRNLSLKMAAVLQWSTEHCAGARHVMKVDEDTFVDLGLVVDLLSEVSRRRHRYVLGYRHPRDHPPAVRFGKWRVSNRTYPFRRFPRYVTGHSYVLSGDAVKALAWAYWHMPLVPNEDAYVTGILATSVGVQGLACSRFAHAVDEDDRCELVAGRSVTQTLFKPPSKFYLMWERLAFGCECPR